MQGYCNNSHRTYQSTSLAMLSIMCIGLETSNLRRRQFCSYQWLWWSPYWTMCNLPGFISVKNFWYDFYQQWPYIFEHGSIKTWIMQCMNFVMLKGDNREIGLVSWLEWTDFEPNMHGSGWNAIHQMVLIVTNYHIVVSFKRTTLCTGGKIWTEILNIL